MLAFESREGARRTKRGFVMITLTMVLCLLSSPVDCRESKLQFMPQGLSVYACAMKGQAQIADPKKRVLREGEFVARYRCEKSGMFAKI